MSDLRAQPSALPVAPYESTPPGTIKVSSPKGTQTWTASELTDSGLPSAAHRAYLNAAKSMASADPGCQLPWTLLAAIGRVESDHGRFGGSVLGRDGVSHPLIIGVALNGVGPVAAIPDSENGRLDKDKVWDRAVGPMQFIPTTWAGAAKDGDGDGVKSPNDIDDAALAAATYLCSGSGSVLGKAAMRAAIFRYNPSEQYVVLVMSLEAGYRTGTFVLPAATVSADTGSVGIDHKKKGAGRKHPTSGPTPNAGNHRPSGSSTPNGRPSGGSSNSPSGGTSTPPEDGTKPKPKPKPKPTPTPTPDPEEKVIVPLNGVLAECGVDWCVDGTTLDVGNEAQLGATAAHNYDQDTAVDETNRLEFDGLVDKQVKLGVEMVDGKAVVYTIDGHDYRFGDDTFKVEAGHLVPVVAG